MFIAAEFLAAMSKVVYRVSLEAIEESSGFKSSKVSIRQRLVSLRENSSETPLEERRGYTSGFEFLVEMRSRREEVTKVIV